MKQVLPVSTGIVLGLGITVLLAFGTSRSSSAQTQCDAPTCTSSRSEVVATTTQAGGRGSICQIQMRQTVQVEDTLRGPSVATAWVDSDGRRLFVVDAFDRHTVSVFDARTGEFLQSLGSRGQGPGEFMAIAGIRVASDSLLVVDQQNQRLTVFDQSLRRAREFSLPINPVGGGQPLTWIPDVGLLMNGWAPTSDAAGMPFHRLSQAGRQELSFGLGPEAGSASPLNLGIMRLVTPHASQTFWSLRATEYLLEQWDVATGTRLRVVAAEDDWVSHAWPNQAQAVQNPPVLLALMEMEGLLWVVGAEPSRPEARGTVQHGIPGTPQPDRGEVMDLRLEVLDPAEGGVLARATLPHYAGFFMSTGELVTFRTFDRPGQMQIWTVELRCQ